MVFIPLANVEKVPFPLSVRLNRAGLTSAPKTGLNEEAAGGFGGGPAAKAAPWVICDVM